MLKVNHHTTVRNVESNAARAQGAKRTVKQQMLMALTIGFSLWSMSSLMYGAHASDHPSEGTNKDVSEPSKVAEAITRPYRASYILSRRGTERGEATRILEKTSDDEWRYYTSSRARILILSDRRENETLFHLADGRVKPSFFDYSREGTGSNQYLRVRFDYENEQVISEGEDPLEVEWHPELLDPNAVLHQLQIDVAGDNDSWTYPLVDERGNYRDYEFARTGNERVETPYGTFDTVQVERVRDHDRRQTLFWFAPELNYTLVQMQQIEEGSEQLRIQLSELDFD